MGNTSFEKKVIFRLEVTFKGLLQQVPLPTLVLWGDNDRVHPVAFCDRLVKQMQQATGHIFEQCGHNPHLEQPDKFAHAIAQWLQESQ